MGALVINKTVKKVIANEVDIADTFLARLKGLLGKSEFKEGMGLIIKPCNSVHSFGMNFNIDVLFLDKNNRIVKIIKNMSPNEISPIVKGAKCVLELPAGVVEKNGVQENHFLELIET